MMELGAVTFFKNLILKEREEVTKEVAKKVTKEVREKTNLDNAVKMYKAGVSIDLLVETLNLSEDLIRSTADAKKNS